MSDINSVVLTGNLTKDCEISNTQKGTAMCRFSIANNLWSGNGETANYFNCTLWGKQAESVSKFLTKGKPVTIQGQLKQNVWVGQDGKKNYSVSINVQNVKLGSQRQKERQQEFHDEVPF